MQTGPQAFDEHAMQVPVPASAAATSAADGGTVQPSDQIPMRLRKPRKHRSA